MVIFIILFLYSSRLFAVEESVDSHSTLPYFASLKNSEVNARSGPNVRYPILWIFIKKDEPVEVIAKFENWRKIKDIAGDGGWVHKSMLSKRRFAVVTSSGKQSLMKDSKSGARIIAHIAPKVRVMLRSCEVDWCKVKITDMEGWIKRSALWGLYANESVQ